MLDLTWEWIGIDEPSLDVANTVAVEKGTEHDLLAPDGEYKRWAAAAAASPALTTDEAAAIAGARPPIRGLREQIRPFLRGAAQGRPLPRAAVAALNKPSR